VPQDLIITGSGGGPLRSMPIRLGSTPVIMLNREGTQTGLPQ
jgi:hypothetical protein